MSKKKNIIIIGAAGRDFHNFNTYYKDKEDVRVVAFTAAQIPDIDGRTYPSELAGALYPDGIPIYSESHLVSLIQELNVDECVFSYSDVSYQTVMSLASQVTAAGADFKLLAAEKTMIKSNKPLISVTAVRTGCGKSQTSVKVIDSLMKLGLKVVAIRHPMPYGDLASQKVQRFATIEDLDKYQCTIEEMEEYEPHIIRGNTIYAGVDYQAIIEAAENDPDGCDVIVWDGGNNDWSFYQADLSITVLDPHRSGHEFNYYPGQVNLISSDVCIINKIDSASKEDVAKVENNIKEANPTATIIKANSKINLDQPNLVKDKRVLIVEDGPTLTHGGMTMGAGTVIAQRIGAKEIIDPRPYASGSIASTFETYQHIGNLLPAMGYSKKQLKDLEETINKIDCDTVIIGTPIDLSRVINIKHDVARVTYELDEIGNPNLDEVLKDFVQAHHL